MMTSAAETPSPLWMSVGMPRPLSRTVHRAVRVERDRDFVGEAGERLVDGVVDHLVDHVVQAGAVVGVADIHARPLAHGVEALEDLDRFRAVVAIVGWDIAGRFSHRREPQNGRKNESDLLFGVTRNLGLVQSKVTAVNMLIQNEFLKSARPKKQPFFEPGWRPNTLGRRSQDRDRATVAGDVALDRSAWAGSPSSCAVSVS